MDRLSLILFLICDHALIVIKVLDFHVYVCFCCVFGSWFATEELVWLEVGNIVSADPRISQSECKARCDAHFSLSDALDESLTDIICQRECELAVAGHTDFQRPPGDRGGRD
ncbi:uncharacterized protein LOC112557264 [Pomacea canaliculata]|uniref:uncharacterized protein LOC112557264 n=1 Tax=Pomacea canaliculata TaxID=400727 RepID=UPI000D72B09A|nr:uncharacterized protein LOC112557264 [Pomacea canaliculata]